MGQGAMKMVICGLSITSSWGNGHATTYRAIAKALAARGHDVLFLERDVPWYADNRDMPAPPGARTRLYAELDELRDLYAAEVRAADLVVVGSYVPQGVEVGVWVVETAGGVAAFYDIDTPVTLSKLERGDYEYLEPGLAGRYDLYLSFTGGPVLERIEKELGSPMARALYCCVDPDLYRPARVATRWDMGYLGTYSADRQPALEELLVAPARSWPDGRFAVAGPQYPEAIAWPANVERMSHLAPGAHAAFYSAQQFALNVTRAEMVRTGWCPSVRLFEAAACSTPIISDRWRGLEDFFAPGREILTASSRAQVLAMLRRMSEDERLEVGDAARRRALSAHTAACRAEYLEGCAREALDAKAVRQAPAAGRRL